METQAHGGAGAWRLDDLVVDAGARTVTRGETTIELPRLSFDLLLALIEAAPDALSTDQAMDRAWQGAVVSPATVAKRVELLRQALGDDKDAPRYVALVRGYGYRLVPAPAPLADEGAAQGSGAPPPAPAARPARRLLFVVAAAALVAAMAGVTWWFLGDRGETPTDPPRRSLAVLPFTALGEEERNQRFAEGLTEEIATALARAGELRVTGRTSAGRFPGRDRDPRAIGETLGVAHLLEGSVRREGDNLTVVARLIDTGDGFVRWSESYDETVSDARAIQRAIAAAVAEALRVALVAPGAAPSVAVTSDPEAYALYLEALGLFPYPTSPDPARAQELLEHALALDPDFADAWTLLGAAHFQRLFFRDPTYTLSPTESVAVARDAAERALAIDPANGGAYGVLAGIAWLIDHDDAKAAELYEQSARLAPWEYPLLLVMAEFTRTLGRLELAQRVQEYVLQRDPLCAECRHTLARTQQLRRDYPAALTNLRVLAAQEPPYGPAPGALRETLLLMGDIDGARRSLAEREDEDSCGTAAVAHAAGDAARAESLWADCVASLEGRAYGWLSLSLTAAFLGKREDALARLETARDAFPLFRMEFQRFWQDPFYDNLRGDPRWLDLLASVGRSPEQLAAIEFSLEGRLDLPEAPPSAQTPAR